MEKMDPTTPTFSKCRIIKNLTVMALSLMFVSASYDGLSMLQSTINEQHHIGTIAMALIYTVTALSSLILPKYANKKMGSKFIFTAGAALFIPYILANFYPCWPTMVPSALLMGIGSSMGWASYSIYFNESAVLYCTASYSNKDQESNVNPNVNYNSNCTTVKVLPDNNSNCTTDKEIAVNISDSTLVKMNSESNCNETSVEVPSQNNSICVSADECNTVEGLSVGNLDTSLVCDFSTRNQTIANDPTRKLFCDSSGDDLSVINTKCNIVEELTVINPNLINSKNTKVSSNEFSSDLNAQDIGIRSCNILKCKGEIVTGVPDVINSYQNESKLTPSIIPIITEDCSQSHSNERCETLKNQVLKSLPELDAESEFKLRHIANHQNQETKESVPRSYKDTPMSDSKKIKLNLVEHVESVTARFFGACGLVFHTAQIWSNLVSYYVLQNKSIEHSVLDSGCNCGAAFCNTESECLVEILEGRRNDVWFSVFTAISLGSAVAAFTLPFLFLDPLGTDKEPVTFSLSNVMATFNHCRKKIQLCLVPISLYGGMIQGFYTADFTKSYVSCSWGSSHVGLVTVSYGAACALSSNLSGCLVKHTGRIPIFLLTYAGSIAANMFLLFWKPDPTYPFMFYVAAGTWGLVSGILWSQVPAFYGILFKKDEEAAFGSYYLFNSLGWALSFACSDFLCTSVKIYNLMTVSSFGIIGYLVAERMYSTRKI